MSARVLYVQYTNPAGYPPLEHSSRILAEAGWQVLFLGTRGQGTEALRFPPHSRIQVRQLPFCQPGWWQKLHYLWFTGWVIAWALRWRPTWLYASDPLACAPAWLASRLPGLRVLYHEHDSPVDAAGGVVGRLSTWFRTRLAARARLRVLPNTQRAQHFAARLAPAGQPVLSVWNCPRLQEVGPPRDPRDAAALDVLYHGSISPSLLPLNVLKALASLPQAVRLHVIGYETVGHPGYAEQLRETARRLGIADRVQVLPALPRSELLQAARRYDVGLALMPTVTDNLNLRWIVGASNKPFDYLASGLAVLVSAQPDWQRTYVEPGYGLACDPDQPASIAAALGWFLAHPAETRRMGELGRRRIAAEWNYETQFAPVVACLNGRSGS